MGIDGYFVTGTDTNIGKTFIAAALTYKLNAHYWKPIQTGSPPDDDTATVQALTQCAASAFTPPAFCFSPPLSPHIAASMAGTRIDTTTLRLPPHRPLIVEGAGGALVPINDTILMRDLIAQFGLPAIIVASTRLGTINHTLLTLEALRAKGIMVQGVIMNGVPNRDNATSIATYGDTRILGEIPHYDTFNLAAIVDAASRITL